MGRLFEAVCELITDILKMGGFSLLFHTFVLLLIFFAIKNISNPSEGVRERIIERTIEKEIPIETERIVYRDRGTSNNESITSYDMFVTSPVVYSGYRGGMVSTDRAYVISNDKD